MSHIWTPELAYAGPGGYVPGMAIDSDGYPHIVSRRSGGSPAYYTYKDGTGWHTETITSIAYYSDAAIVLDSNDIPHIVYCAPTTMKYTNRIGGAWSAAETVSTFASTSVSAAIDSGDVIHAAFHYSVGTKDLYYVEGTAGSWADEAVDTTGNVGNWPSIALDSNGDPHISYSEEVGRLKYATKVGVGAWSIVVVDASTLSTHYSAIAIDESGYPAIAYEDVTNKKLMYARKTGAGWGAPEIASSHALDWMGQINSIALDDYGNPYIAHYSGNDRALMFTWWDGEDWQTEVADETTADIGLYPTLALLSGGSAGIAYQDRSNDKVYYATAEGVYIPRRRALWLAETGGNMINHLTPLGVA